jgi:hypothetical protein
VAFFLLGFDLDGFEADRVLLACGLLRWPFLAVLGLADFCLGLGT